MMLTDAAVVFAIRGVSRQVQLVFDAPVSAIECEQAMFIRFFDQEAGDATDGFFGDGRSLGSSALYHKNLCREGKVDSAGGDGRGDDTATAVPPVGFFNRAVCRGKKCAPRGAVRSGGASQIDSLLR